MKIKDCWNEWILKEVDIYFTLYNLVNMCKNIIKMRDYDLNKLNDKCIIININE